MSGDGSLGYQSQETSHYISQHHKNNGIYDDGSLGMSMGDGRSVFRYQHTSQSSSHNHGVYHHGYKIGDDEIYGYRSQETSHSSSRNYGVSVDGDGRGGYRYQIIHSPYYKPGDLGIFTALSFYSIPVDKFFHGYVRGGYIYQTSQYPSHKPGGCGRFLCRSVASRPVDKNFHGDDKGDLSVDNIRCGFSSQDTSNSSFHSQGESVDGYGGGEYRSLTRHYHSHNPGGHGRFLVFSVDYHPVHKIVHDNERGDRSGDYGRGGFRSQETRKYYFQNSKDSVHGDGRG